MAPNPIRWWRRSREPAPPAGRLGRSARPNSPACRPCALGDLETLADALLDVQGRGKARIGPHLHQMRAERLQEIEARATLCW